mmetsp:Transcript_11152/g.22505  ORF Transcript_11152/g.22505 Transcript_11152/m.22505 type:complete len:211 (-) Transcript_11152:315-947(-)
MQTPLCASRRQTLHTSTPLHPDAATTALVPCTTTHVGPTHLSSRIDTRRAYVHAMRHAHTMHAHAQLHTCTGTGAASACATSSMRMCMMSMGARVGQKRATIIALQGGRMRGQPRARHLRHERRAERLKRRVERGPAVKIRCCIWSMGITACTIATGTCTVVTTCIGRSTSTVGTSTATLCALTSLTHAADSEEVVHRSAPRRYTKVEVA